MLRETPMVLLLTFCCLIYAVTASGSEKDSDSEHSNKKSPHSSAHNSPHSSRHSSPEKPSSGNPSRDPTPQRSPNNSPQQSPKHSPQQSPKNSPKQSPKNSPNHSPQQSPNNSPKQSPKQSPNHSPQQSPKNSPQQSPKQSPNHSPQQSPKNSPQQSPNHSPKSSSSSDHSLVIQSQPPPLSLSGDLAASTSDAIIPETPRAVAAPHSPTSLLHHDGSPPDSPTSVARSSDSSFESVSNSIASLFAEMDVRVTSVDNVVNFVNKVHEKQEEFFGSFTVDGKREEAVRAMVTEYNPQLMVDPLLDSKDPVGVGRELREFLQELVSRCKKFVPRNAGTSSEREAAERLCTIGTILAATEKMAQKWRNYEEDEEDEEEEGIPDLEDECPAEEQQTEKHGPSSSSSSSAEKDHSPQQPVLPPSSGSVCPPDSCQPTPAGRMTRLLWPLARLINCCRSLCHFVKDRFRQMPILNMIRRRTAKTEIEEEEMEEEDQLACANMIVAFLGEALNDWELAKKYAVDNGVIQDREIVDAINGLEKAKLGEFFGSHIKLIEEDEEEREIPSVDQID